MLKLDKGRRGMLQCVTTEGPWSCSCFHPREGHAAAFAAAQRTRSKPGRRAYRRFSIYPVCVGGRVLLVSALATG